MKTSMWLRLVAACTLAASLAACSGGGEEPGGGQPPAEQQGVFRSIGVWAGSINTDGGSGDRDGQGAEARFNHPTAVTVAGDGTLRVLDANGIRGIDPQGKVGTLIPGSALTLPDTQANGRNISYHSVAPPMAIGPSGEIFVAMVRATWNDQSSAQHRVVLRIAPNAAPVIVAVQAHEARPSSLPWTSALALDRQGRLYVGDRECNISRTDGEVLGTATPRALVLVHATDPAHPGAPCADQAADHGIRGLTLDADGRVVFSVGSGDVRRIEADGRITTMARLTLDDDMGGALALDRDGRLLVANGPVLLRLDAAGQAQVVAGSATQRGWFDGPASTARFSKLAAVAVDREGRIVLTDLDKHTVRRIAADGTVSTVAGLAEQSGYQDGTGAQAVFGSIAGIGPGPNGEVLVADQRNAAVRRVDALQRVTTIVGVPGRVSALDPPADGPVATTPLLHPTHALMAPDGKLWFSEGRLLRVLGTDGIVRTVEDFGPSTVYDMAVQPDGSVLVIWGLSFGSPRGPSIGSAFARYPASASLAGKEWVETNLPLELANRLKNTIAYGLCVLPQGAFAFTQGHAVLRRNADGSVTLLAGSPDEAGSSDGSVAAARFNRPGGLACDAAGGIYVADTNNYTVRYIDTRGQVRTVLGTAGRPGHRVDAVPGELTPRSLVLVPGGLVVNTGTGLVRAGF